MADYFPGIPTDISPHTQRVMEFFLARQPVLNRDQGLFAYELLFRRPGARSAEVTNDLSATAAVIAHAAELGLENVIGSSLGFINVDAAVLMSDFIHFLPKRKVVLEILETVQVTDRVIARVTELSRVGFTFALDDVVAASDGVQRLLPLVDIIKVDISDMEWGRLASLSRQFSQADKKILAEKVETLEQFQRCLDFDFDYFQGYYFARPTILSGKQLSHSQVAIVQLIAQIASDAALGDIERAIERDSSLGLSLLRLVNTPVSGVTHRIDSLREALRLLGRQQVQRWLHILLYAESGATKGTSSPLLALATTRGRLLELMAEEMSPGDERKASIAFTVGFLSLMDALFNVPMEEILHQVRVADEVKNALLFSTGAYGDMLKLVECIDRTDASDLLVESLLKKLKLSAEQLYRLQLAAFEWSESISRTAN